MLQIKNLSKSYSIQNVFKDLTFSLKNNDKIGLIGRNGTGKTTLFKILTQQETGDSGSVFIPKDYTIGYLTQHFKFTESTILAEVINGLPESNKNQEWQAKKILSGLGFSTEELNKSADFFSGGYQIRINLAKTLISSPDLLLLDEPTNFLDIVSIRWLENFLKKWANSFIIISHDRSFLDKICNSIIGIHRKKIKKVEGSTAKYFQQIKQEEESYERMRLNAEKKRKQTEIFISKFKAKARQANLAQSRIKALEKQEVLKKLDKISTLNFTFNYNNFEAKTVMDIKEISFKYSSNCPNLINKLSFCINKNDKICIIGKNGKGKTTLLKLLTNKLQPQKGDIRKNPQVIISYFEQSHTAELQDDLSIEQEIMLSMGNNDQKKARDICGIMMFSGDNALKPIKVLSGGEKCRTLLGKLIVKPANTLILDEPTRHLDLESTEALVDAINNFPGAVILVTHNESIINRIAKKIIFFQENEIIIFEGTYNEFQNKFNIDDECAKKKETTKTNKKNIDKRVRAEYIKLRSKILTPIKTEISNIENNIEKQENDLAENNRKIVLASLSSNKHEIKELSANIKDIQKKIDTLYEELEICNNKLDKEEQKFKEN